jgi:hypothetical protein
MSESAILIGGNKEAAKLVAERMGRTVDVRDTVTNYDSPDGLQRITYREVASSDPEVIAKGYKPEATLDVLKLIDNKMTRFGEIKFVSK